MDASSREITFRFTHASRAQQVGERDAKPDLRPDKAEPGDDRVRGHRCIGRHGGAYVLQQLRRAARVQAVGRDVQQRVLLAWRMWGREGA